MFTNARVMLVLGLLCVGCVPTWIALVAPEHRSHSISKKRSLQNLLHPAPNVYSGGEPKRPDDFAALAQLGVRTVLSVDGVRPNLELASEHGLEYIHVPVGYDGIDIHARDSLVRLVRDHTGPFYIHCHHGKHRGPAAAAIVCRAMGQFDTNQAIQFLKLAGTNPLYAGLYRDVRDFKNPPSDAPLPNLVSVAEAKSLVVQMGSIDRIFDRLSEQIQVDAQAVDVQAEDALLLLEAFREAARHLEQDDVAPQRGLLAAMQKAVADCQELRNAARNPTDRRQILGRMSQRCIGCHSRHRDAN